MPEIKPKNTKIYHGTDKVFDDFDIKKSADGTIWFTDKIDEITDPKQGVAAAGKGKIVQRELPNNLKLANDDLIDKYSVDELINQGYDGVKYSPNPNGSTWYQVFYPEKLKKTLGAIQEANESKTGMNLLTEMNDALSAKNYTKAKQVLDAAKQSDKYKSYVSSFESLIKNIAPKK